METKALTHVLFAISFLKLGNKSFLINVLHGQPIQSRIKIILGPITIFFCDERQVTRN